MTTQKTFKHKVCARMAKTGESYTAARRMLIAGGEAPPMADGYEPVVSDEAMVEAIGHGPEHWLALLDGWDGTTRTHGALAAWLVDAQGLPGWWAQTVALTYERARGMRVKNQRSDGTFSATATKTVAVAVEQLYATFVDDELRRPWLPGAYLHERTATAHKGARYDWGDGSSRVVVGFEAKGPSKSIVALEHEHLPDGDTAEAMKAWWRDQLAELKAHLEARG